MTTTIYEIFTLILFFISPGNAENSVLSSYNIPDAKPPQVIISNKLNEISGLTVADGGKVFAHNDERGIIYRINIETGEVVKKFFLGRWTIEGDFEGIAAAGGKMYLINSSGTLYEFEEGENERAVNYEIYKTGASSRFDVEGLCYDPETNSLLFACKEYPGKNYEGYRAVYSYSLDKHEVNKIPRFLISIEAVTKKLGTKNFHPSGIERHPGTGNFLIIGAKNGNAIVELNSEGELVDAVKLNNKYHNQPEGITFLPDARMIIADEKVKKHALLSLYSPHK